MRVLERFQNIQIPGRELFMRAASQARLGYAALVVALIFTAWHDAALLMRHPVAVGIDGYYYVLQLNELAAHGRFYFPTRTPLVLYVLTVLKHLTGDTIIAIKIGSVLFHALLCLGIFAVIASTIRNLWLGVLGSTLAAVSGLHLYALSEFVNNTGALVLLLWSGWCLIRLTQTRRRIWITASVILLVAACFSHRSASLIALSIALSILLIRWLTQTAIKKVFACLVIAILWVCPLIISAQSLVSVPAWFMNQVTVRPHWPFGTLFFAEELILAIASPAVLFLIIRSARKTRTTTFNCVFGSVALWSLIVTLNPFLNPAAGLSGVAARLRVLSYIQVALILPGLLWLARFIRRELSLYAAAIFLPLVFLSMRALPPSGLKPEFLARREELIRSLKLHSSELAQQSMIIAPHGDQFVVTASIGVPSQQRPPDNSRYGRVYWLLNEVNDQPLTNGSIVLMTEKERTTILVEEAVLKRRLETMNDFERRRLLRANPYLAKAYSPSRQS